MRLSDIFQFVNLEGHLYEYEYTKSHALNKVVFDLKSRDIDSIVSLINRFMFNGVVEIDSPVTGKRSVAVASSNKRGSQYLLMKDDDNEFWIIVQSQNFIDCIITPSKVFFTLHRFLGESAVKGLDKIINYFDSLDSFNTTLGGFYIHNARPFHFFYDNLKSLIYLKESTPKDAFDHYNVCIENNFYYTDCIFLNQVNKPDRERVYLAPLLISQRLGNAINNPWSKNAMEAMEHNLRNSTRMSSSGLPFDKTNYDMVLWIGITGQKRSWIEQVSGYTAIINELNKSYKSLLVIVDGLTATDGEMISVPEDIEVFNRIKRSCNDSIKFISVIGMDYTSKIAICNEVDFFIANAGSGSVVPLRFSQKDGVLHSNLSINTFPDDYQGKGQDVRKVSDDLIVEENLNQPSNMNVSYHVPWKSIYNLLISIINNKKGVSHTPLEISEEDMIVNHIDDMTVLRILEERFKSLSFIKDKRDLAEIFREIGTGFEAAGNYKMAQTLMLYAYKLRPNSKIIKEKFALYEKINNKE